MFPWGFEILSNFCEEVVPQRSLNELTSSLKFTTIINNSNSIESGFFFFIVTAYFTEFQPTILRWWFLRNSALGWPPMKLDQLALINQWDSNIYSKVFWKRHLPFKLALSWHSDVKCHPYQYPASIVSSDSSSQKSTWVRMRMQDQFMNGLRLTK